MKAKAEARVALQDLMQRPLTENERRHPWDVMLDAYQRLDQVMQHGDFPDGLGYVEHLERMLRAGKALAESKVAERKAEILHRHWQTEGKLITEAVVAGVDALFDALFSVLPLTYAQREELRARTLAVAAATLAGQSPPPIPEVQPAPAAVVVDAYTQNMAALLPSVQRGASTELVRSSAQQTTS